jgi:cell division septation protein DedD
VLIGMGQIFNGSESSGLGGSAAAAGQSTTLQVKASADDARGTNTTEAIAQVGAGDGKTANVNGFRFNGLQIPAGSTIESVQFSLVKKSAQWQRFAVTLSFEASGNAATFSTSATPDQRPQTGAKAAIDNTQQWADGTRYTLGDQATLAKALQEVINRSDWRAGNSVALIAAGAATPAWARLGFATYDGGTANAPQLIVTYSGGSTATATATPKPSSTSTPAPTATQTPRPATTPTPATTATPPPSTNPTPVAGQPCPTWVHDQYRATGPDGKLYATWHPPTDPQYGCTFGHEHGADPTGAPALRGRTILFDYVNALAGRSEAHVGFKIFRWDNVQHPNAGANTGAQVVMMIHQGSSTDNAFMETRHEIAVHYYNPNDGRELHVTMLAPFGALGIGCGANDPALFKIQQANTPGMRQIPGEKCFGAALKNAAGTVPNSIPYEDWITALYIGTDAQGNNAKAYFDPHFAIFNPNRYCIIQNNACVLGRSDERAQTGIDPYSTQSAYKGAKREAYLNQAQLRNAGGSTTIWTDVDGHLVGANTPGAIQQYVAAVTVTPQVDSSAFGADDVHDDGSVHAPN